MAVIDKGYGFLTLEPRVENSSSAGGSVCRLLSNAFNTKYGKRTGLGSSLKLCAPVGLMASIDGRKPGKCNCNGPWLSDTLKTPGQRDAI
jgi:hypothetical protein